MTNLPNELVKMGGRTETGRDNNRTNIANSYKESEGRCGELDRLRSVGKQCIKGYLSITHHIKRLRKMRTGMLGMYYTYPLLFTDKLLCISLSYMNCRILYLLTFHKNYQKSISLKPISKCLFLSNFFVIFFSSSCFL